MRLALGGPTTPIAALAALLTLGAALPGGHRHGDAPRGGRSAGQSSTLRILAYNVRHGSGMDDVVDLTRAARVISAQQPDVVALQEIDNRTTRTGGVDQAQRLGELTGMHAAFGAFMDYAGGEYGMALLAKSPFSRVTNHRLPDGDEPRSALAARIQLGDSGPEVVIVGIHLYRTAEERLAQAQRIVDIFENEQAPVILIGDFNSTPDSPVIALLSETWTIPDKGTDHLTFSSRDPRREIDYIMYRPSDRFEVVTLDVIDEPLASDHRPVLLELRWRAPLP